ncbi:MAG TPA: DNA repair protein RecO [Roseimicrobium sp.]|nr:DNA repair protein RecO [Roseimicrobium sp.]
MPSYETTSGLILRIRPLSDTSLIVHWLTPDLGRLATVAKGARGAKSSFRGKLDIFYHCDLSFARSRRSDLHALREVMLKETHGKLRTDWGALQQAAYAVSFLEKNTETETPVPEVYDLITGYITHLAAKGASKSLVPAMEWKFLEVLGLTPELESIRIAPAAKQWLESVSGAGWEEIAAPAGCPKIEDDITRFLQRYIQYHCGRIPPGRNAALGADAVGTESGIQNSES